MTNISKRFLEGITCETTSFQFLTLSHSSQAYTQQGRLGSMQISYFGTSKQACKQTDKQKEKAPKKKVKKSLNLVDLSNSALYFHFTNC